VLVDDDLLFEDGPRSPRPVVAVNRWLRELPVSGAPAPATWEAYARAIREWMEFLVPHGVGVFDSRERLKLALSRYASTGLPARRRQRFSAVTWGRHMSILSLFYRWAMEEGHAQAEPFNLPDGAGTVRGDGPRGPGEPGGAADSEAARDDQVPGTRLHRAVPRQLARAGTRRVRRRRLSRLGADAQRRGRRAGAGHWTPLAGVHLPAALEVPVLPSRPTARPIPFPVPAGVTKGRKFRTTWTSYDALAAVHGYLALDRAATADGSRWRPPPRWASRCW